VFLISKKFAKNKKVSSLNRQLKTQYFADKNIFYLVNGKIKIYNLWY